MKRVIIIATALLCISTFSLSAQATINVPGDYPTIQAALNVAEEGTSILVAPGVYNENILWPITVDGIELIGEKGHVETIIDGQNEGRVITMEKQWNSTGSSIVYTDATVIKGFTIRNGYINGDDGAGLYIGGGSPRLIDLKFSSNLVESESAVGGGASLHDFNGEIINCQFTDNIANGTTGSFGGGLYLSILDTVSIRDCLFDNNKCISEESCRGGAMYIDANSSTDVFSHLEIVKTRFNGNLTSAPGIWSTGGAIHVEEDLYQLKIDSCLFSNNIVDNGLWSHGGAIYSASRDVNVLSSKFINNSAESGGAIFLFTLGSRPSTVHIEKTAFKNNIASFHNGAAIYAASIVDLTLDNCILDHNAGSSIYFFAGMVDQLIESHLNINQSTLAYNEDGVYFDRLYLNVKNSILWKNGENEVIEGSSNLSQVDIQNSLVKGGFDGIGNLDNDPLFVSESFLYPRENSPCLGVGIPVGFSEDLLGNPRPLPTNSNPDIGAYEVDQYLPHVRVKFYLDQNENGYKDDTEFYTSLGSVIVNDGKVYNNFRKEGIFIIAQQGLFTVEYDNSTNLIWTTLGQSQFNYNVDSEDFAEVIEIGLNASDIISDVQTIVTGDRFRCSEDVDFTLKLKNRGTTIESGILWLNIDNRVADVSFSTMPDYIENDHKVGWDFSDLLPNECVDINYVVTAPSIDNAEQVGEFYCFESQWQNEAFTREESYIYKTELRCSFDPNDKQVHPYRSDDLALDTSELVYTVRFQNTGNDYALNVIIRDTLDENLDMSSFSIIGTSHPEHLTVSIEDARAVAFEFAALYLPDSLTNEPESHGFITYSIKPVEGVVLDTDIKNTAHIYFDFNPAIVTNTTHSIMVDEFPLSSTTEQTLFSVLSFPNPASDFIDLSTSVDRLKVLDVQGRMVIELKNINKIDIRSLDAGSYFVEYYIGDKVATDKWVIIRQ